MACQFQPECNFLHIFFKCKLAMEVVDVEVKITSMQGTHLYKKDRTMQVIKCLLWTNNIQPHPTIIKKMKTFLEVENKKGTTIQTSMPNSQIRPPLPITNANVCRSDNVERRKTVTPKRKFRPVTAANPPIPQAPPKPIYEVPSTAVRVDTPWPGAGKTASNPIDDRQWLLLKGYPAIQNKESDNDIPSPKEEMKAEKPVISDGPITNVDGDPIAPSVKCRRRKKRKTHKTDPYQTHKPRG